MCRPFAPPEALSIEVGLASPWNRLDSRSFRAQYVCLDEGETPATRSSLAQSPIREPRISSRGTKEL